MAKTNPHLANEPPPQTSDYLGHRLDGARDLYLLALALGDRPDGSPLFGRMIREARIHFAAVIEEAPGSPGSTPAPSPPCSAS